MKGMGSVRVAFHSRPCQPGTLAVRVFAVFMGMSRVCVSCDHWTQGHAVRSAAATGVGIALCAHVKWGRTGCCPATQVQDTWWLGAQLASIAMLYIAACIICSM